MYFPQHWELKKSYFHSPEVEKDIWKSSSPFCSLSSCQQSEVLNGMGENHLPAFAGSAAVFLDMGKWSPPQRVITTRAIKWWHCQSKAVFWYCVSWISFPVWSPRRIFLFFLSICGLKTEILIKVLEGSRKGEQSPVAIRRLCFLSLCRSQVISGPESCSLSMADSRNHAPILWNNGAGVSSLLQFWKRSL